MGVGVGITAGTKVGNGVAVVVGVGALMAVGVRVTAVGIGAATDPCRSRTSTIDPPALTAAGSAAINFSPMANTENPGVLAR